MGMMVLRGGGLLAKEDNSTPVHSSFPSGVVQHSLDCLTNSLG